MDVIFCLWTKLHNMTFRFIPSRCLIPLNERTPPGAESVQIAIRLSSLNCIVFHSAGSLFRSNNITRMGMPGVWFKDSRMDNVDECRTPFLVCQWEHQIWIMRLQFEIDMWNKHTSTLSPHQCNIFDWNCWLTLFSWVLHCLQGLWFTSNQNYRSAFPGTGWFLTEVFSGWKGETPENLLSCTRINLYYLLALKTL